MSRARALLAAWLAFMPAATLAQDPALRLETLAERIAKLHAQLGQGVLQDRSRRALPEAVREFDAGLRASAGRASAAEVRDNYVLLGLLWQDYRAWALRPPTRDNARKLSDRAEEVTWVAAKGARMLNERGRTGTGLLALQAAHAATLAQRVARLHLLRRWGLRDAGLARELSLASADLRGTLERLRAAPHNTPEIDTELQVAEGQLAFLVQAARELEGGRGSLKQMEFIAKAGDHILESMQRVMRLYEGLPG